MTFGFTGVVVSLELDVELSEDEGVGFASATDSSAVRVRAFLANILNNSDCGWITSEAWRRQALMRRESNTYMYPSTANPMRPFVDSSNTGHRSATEPFIFYRESHAMTSKNHLFERSLSRKWRMRHLVPSVCVQKVGSIRGPKRRWSMPSLRGAA